MATTNEDKDVFTFDKFLGLRNTVGIESLESGDLTVALNVDQTDAYRLRRRKGFEATGVTTARHSIWSDGTTALAVENTSLVRIMPDLSEVVLRDDLTPGARMFYAVIGDRIFFSNGVDTGVVQNGLARSWGLLPPAKLPIVSVIGGSLPAGLYQYTQVYVRSDGQESGAPPSGNFQLPVRGGLKFSDIAVSPEPEVVFKRIYISDVNGDQLYATLNLPADVTEATYVEPRRGTLPLATQFLSRPAAGTLLGHFAGHILLARGNTLYRTETYGPELFDYRKGLPTPGRVTLVAPMDDGVYLGTDDEIFWLNGRNPAEWRLDRKDVHGAVYGTAAYGPADDVAEGQNGQVVIFVGTKGIVAALNGGTLLSLTEERFSFPLMAEGSAIIRHFGGTIQYVVTLRGAEGISNVAF